MTDTLRHARSRLPTSLRLPACAILLAWGVAPAWAQLAPVQVDPGALQRQEEERRRYLEEQNRIKERPVVVDAPAAAPAALPAAGGARFVLTDVTFGPSTLLTAAELQAVAARYVGKEVDFGGLTRLVDDVNALYRAHGVVTARAVIGPQKIAGGVVRVDLVEARLERVDVQGARYSSGEYVKNLFADQQGQTLDTAALETRVMRFNRGGDLRVEASLKPGSATGTTDLVLSLIEPPRYQARVFANNEGPRSVGSAQIGVDGTFHGPFGIGDKLAAYVARTRGATSGSLSYAVPVNRYGGRLTGTYSQGVTDVVAGPYRELGINGRSKSLQAGFVQPVWRRGAWWFDAAATLGKTRSDNRIGALPLSHTDVVDQTLGATATGLWDGRSINLSLSATHAREQALDKAARGFTITQLRGSWVEALNPKDFIVLRTLVQQTGATILTPSLLFQVGGVATVRGYEVGALSGDRGQVTNAEFHHALRDGVDASLFADVGTVRTTGQPNQSAHSVGAAVDFQLRQSLQANVTAGRTLKKVLPDQAPWRLTARVSYLF